MAIKGVSLAEREQFILHNDPGHKDHPEYKKALAESREPEKPTIFYIGNLTKAQRIELGDMTVSPTMRDGGITMDMKSTRRAYMVVQAGLKGWENMLDSNGKVVEFAEATEQTSEGFVRVASDACLIHLDAETIRELSAKILEKNGMSKALEKNFAAPFPQFGVQSFGNGAAPNAPQKTNEQEDATVPPSPESEL